MTYHNAIVMQKRNERRVGWQIVADERKQDHRKHILFGKLLSNITTLRCVLRIGEALMSNKELFEILRRLSASEKRLVCDFLLPDSLRTIDLFEQSSVKS